mmetsp:Transcript_50552/g.94174  ORF Transcript_50552/g.94174 Transcript_50552/m.94174 type:complete len:275 (-) Transcript_50552:86-910(-)
MKSAFMTMLPAGTLSRRSSQSTLRRTSPCQRTWSAPTFSATWWCCGSAGCTRTSTRSVACPWTTTCARRTRWLWAGRTSSPPTTRLSPGTLCADARFCSGSSWGFRATRCSVGCATASRASPSFDSATTRTATRSRGRARACGPTWCCADPSAGATRWRRTTLGGCAFCRAWLSARTPPARTASPPPRPRCLRCTTTWAAGRFRAGGTRGASPSTRSSTAGPRVATRTRSAPRSRWCTPCLTTSRARRLMCGQACRSPRRMRRVRPLGTVPSRV